MKTILFDFDGVIVDSFQAAFGVHKNFRGDGFTENHYRDFHDGNIFKSGIVDEIVTEEEFYKNYIPKFMQLPMLEGVVEVLEKLKERYNLIIISSTNSSTILEWLSKHNLAKYFTEIVGSDVHKSKEEKIKMIFDKYDVKASDCVFITDTLGDLREAAKAGVASLAVTYGFHEKERLRKGNPAGFIKSPQDMIQEIEKYWNNKNP
jgi:phosphoglycolate phosphatase